MHYAFKFRSSSVPVSLGQSFPATKWLNASSHQVCKGHGYIPRFTFPRTAKPSDKNAMPLLSSNRLATRNVEFLDFFASVSCTHGAYFPASYYDDPLTRSGRGGTTS